MGFSIGFERRRNAYGLIAYVVHVTFENETISVPGFAFDQRLPHIGTYCSRRGGVKVVISVDPLRAKISGKATEARDATHEWVNDGLHQRRRDGGIDSVTSGS